MMRFFFFLTMCFVVVITKSQSYQGLVKDANTGLPIENATVRIFNKDSLMIAGTITNKEGYFLIASQGIATKLLITFVGYEDWSLTNSEIPFDLGTVLLQNNLQLEEVVVTSQLTTRDADKTTFLITDSLRKGTINTSQMLDKISGIKSDWITGAIKVGHEENVLVVINGKERGNEYALNLNPERIKTVEIIRNPTGKYSEYNMVVNLELKDDYKGWDISPKAIGIFSLNHGYTNQENITTDFTYTFNKWNIYGTAGYKRKFIHDAYFFEKQYDENYIERTEKPDLDQPNKLNHQNNALFSLGIDYNFKKNQSVSIQAWADIVDNKDTLGYKTNITEQSNENIQDQKSTNNYYSDNYIVGMFYRGSFFEKLNITNDLTYNYYKIKENREFLQGINYYSQNNYIGHKNYVRYAIDSDYKVLSSFNISLNYSFTYRNYNNKKRESGESIYFSDNTRNIIEANLSYHPNNKFQIRGGSSILFVNDKNSSEGMNNTSLMPYFKLYWKPLKKTNFSVNYHCSVEHPNLDQLSTVEWQVDTYLRHRGNPDLKPTVMHYAEAILEVEKLFTITYLWKTLKNDISPWYTKLNDMQYVESLKNCDFQHSYISILGDYNIGKFWRYYIHLAYQRYKRKAEDNKKCYGDVYSIDTNLAYHIAPLNLNVMAAYYLRYDKSPLLQGTQFTEEESLSFGLNRSFCKGRMPISLMVRVPTQAISKCRYTKIEMDSYKTSNYSDDRVNNFALMFSVQYKIGGGKSTRKNYNETIIDKEK